MYEVAFKVLYFKVLWITNPELKETRSEVSWVNLSTCSFLLRLEPLLSPLLSLVCSGCAGRLRTMQCKVQPTSMLLETYGLRISNLNSCLQHSGSGAKCPARDPSWRDDFQKPASCKQARIWRPTPTGAAAPQPGGSGGREVLTKGGLGVYQ